MRYILFTHNRYYPIGGVGDISGWFNDLDDAIASAEALVPAVYNYAEILDVELQEEVWSKSSR